MSVEVIFQSEPIARKDYPCDACQFLEDIGSLERLTFAERRAIARAKANKQKIKKGERYLRQFNAYGGDRWTFRAIPAIHDIMCKYDLYPEQ